MEVTDELYHSVIFRQCFT